MALYVAEALGIRSNGRRKVNTFEMKCFEKFGESVTNDWIKNGEARRRAGIERDMASRTDQKVLRWFRHVERMDEYRIPRRVLMAEVSGGLVRW